MSWNWLRRRIFQSSSISVAGYLNLDVRGEHREELDVVKEEFGLAVSAFRLRLGGVGAAVVFEVEFADEARAIGDVFFESRRRNRHCVRIWVRGRPCRSFARRRVSIMA